MASRDSTRTRLRAARSRDQTSIDALIHEAGINPLGLDWRRFLVAESPDGIVVGCGQLKEHRDGSLELASLAVAGQWQGEGIGGRIVQALIERADQTLWLMCRSGLVPYYQKFGFREVPPEGEQPPYFRRVRRLARLYHAVVSRGDYLAVMSREPNQR